VEAVKSCYRGMAVTMETGGHYWCNTAYYLNESRISFRFINQYGSTTIPIVSEE
jgi:hypothetical protein